MKKINLDVDGWSNPVSVIQNKTIRRSAEKFLARNKDNPNIRSGQWMNKRGDIVDNAIDESYLYFEDFGNRIFVQKSVFLHRNPSYEELLR